MPLSEAAKAECQDLIKRYPTRKCAMLMVLHVVQREYGYITEEAMREVAQILGCQPVEVGDVVSFYFMLRQNKVGKRVISVCDTLSCALNGAFGLIEHLETALNVRCGETTEDGEFLVEAVECLGACSDAPIVAIDFYNYYDVTPDKLDGMVASMRKGDPPTPEWRDPKDWLPPDQVSEPNVPSKS